MQYVVTMIRSEEGVAVWVPALPGCASQGDTEEEALENIRDAIKEYLAVDVGPRETIETRIVDVA